MKPTYKGTKRASEDESVSETHVYVIRQCGFGGRCVTLPFFTIKLIKWVHNVMHLPI